MNSELEAILRCRRCKADGLPCSPSPDRKGKLVEVLQVLTTVTNGDQYDSIRLLYH